MRVRSWPALWRVPSVSSLRIRALAGAVGLELEDGRRGGAGEVRVLEAVVVAELHGVVHDALVRAGDEARASADVVHAHARRLVQKRARVPLHEAVERGGVCARARDVRRGAAAAARGLCARELDGRLGEDALARARVVDDGPGERVVELVQKRLRRVGAHERDRSRLGRGWHLDGGKRAADLEAAAAELGVRAGEAAELRLQQAALRRVGAVGEVDHPQEVEAALGLEHVVRATHDVAARGEHHLAHGRVKAAREHGLAKAAQVAVGQALRHLEAFRLRHDEAGVGPKPREQLYGRVLAAIADDVGCHDLLPD